jgi:hypothetical protein
MFNSFLSDTDEDSDGVARRKRLFQGLVQPPVQPVLRILESVLTLFPGSIGAGLRVVAFRRQALVISPVSLSHDHLQFVLGACRQGAFMRTHAPRSAMAQCG